MKTLKYILGKSLSLIGLSVILAGCGSDNEPQPASDKKFSVTSEDINCVEGKTSSILVPFAGKNYRLSVTASDDVSWNVTTESTPGFITVSPQGEQTGKGTIEIKAAANPDKTEGKEAVVAISNNISGKYMEIFLEQKEKELYFPEGSEGQTAADFKKPASKYNIHYMKEGPNVAILWDRAMGINPLQAKRSFDPDKALKAVEEVYAFLVDELGFANRTTSYANKRKFLVFVRNDDNGTALGGGDNGVGKFWVSPLHLQNDRYGIFYHEMCHCFQFMAKYDGAADTTGPVHEMTSQWALMRRFPNWIDLERSHFNDFMKLTHLTLGHEANGYHSPYVLEYWADKHGVTMVSRIWKEAKPEDNGDFIATYMRLTGIDQETFNDEIYDAAARFITWDLKHIKDEYAKHGGANVHTCELKQLDSKTYQITSGRCPQNYGYNGIKLKVPATSGTKISLTFQGIMNSNEYHYENKDKQGWRYGFLAVKKNGERVYGDMARYNGKGTDVHEFTVPENTQHLWLIVTGAPTKHWKHVVDKDDRSNDESWPYKITLINTEPDNEFCKVVK